MIDRCHDPNSDGYRKYGARGIAVCDEWRTDFNAFRDWSLANGYAPHLQIDRRKDAQGYSPGNCRWATASQQAGNRKKRRDGKVSKFKGVSRHNSGRWTAEIMVRGQRRRLGTFGTEKEAALAYDSAAKEGFGEFALTNFGE